MVLYGKVLQTIPVWVTLTKGHGHRGWWKILKNSNKDIFSDTVSTAVMKLGKKVHCGLSLQAIPVSVTSIKDHCHRGWWKFFKNSDIGIFSNSVTHCSHGTWQKGTLWLGLSFPTPKVRITGVDGKSCRTKIWTFSQAPWALQSWNLVQRYFVARPLQAIPGWLTFIQGHGHSG